MQRAFPKDSTSTWHNQDLNLGPPDPKDYDATLQQIPMTVLGLRPELNSAHLKSPDALVFAILQNLKTKKLMRTATHTPKSLAYISLSS